jgi:hypothetical protein
MADKQVPPLIEKRDNVALNVVRRVVFGRQKVAGPSVVAEITERLTHPP